MLAFKILRKEANKSKEACIKKARKYKAKWKNACNHETMNASKQIARVHATKNVSSKLAKCTNVSYQVSRKQASNRNNA